MCYIVYRLAKGVTVCIEALAFALFEKGDVVITPTPTYARFYADFEERAGVKLIGFPLLEEDDFLMTAPRLETFIKKAKINLKESVVKLNTEPITPCCSICSVLPTRRRLRPSKSIIALFLAPFLFPPLSRYHKL